MFTFLFTFVAQDNAAEPGPMISSDGCSNPVALTKENHSKKTVSIPVFIISWIESTLVINLPLPEVKCKEQRMMLTSGERR